MPELSEQLRALVEASAEPLRVSEVATRVTPHGPPRRRRGVAAVAVAVAAALVAVGVGVAIGRRGSRHATTVTTGLPTAPGWHPFSPGPLLPRTEMVTAWTGTRLLVWGGDSPHGSLTDGALYDPATDTWRPMAPGPLVDDSIGHTGAWDGTELLVWEHDWSGAKAGGAGAAYNPATNTWRRLASNLLPAGLNPPTLVWDGHALLVWAATRPDGTTKPSASVFDAYDPGRDRWTSLPAGPVDVNNTAGVWTGSELLVLGWQTNAANGVFPTGGFRPAAAYDPATNRWRTIPAPPWDPGESGSALTMAWTGTQAVAYTYALRSAAFDPTVSRWTLLADLPLAARECYPTSSAIAGAVLAFYCGQAALLTPGSPTWTAVDTPWTPSGSTVPVTGDAPASPPIGAGTRLLVWGAGDLSSAQWRTGAWQYIPPPTTVGSARLSRPEALAATPTGDVLIADQGTNQIFRRRADGQLSVIAGTGTAGYTGDGRPAVDAGLSRPSGIAVAGDGTIYVADTANNRVRAIAADGTIVTVAGNGAEGSGAGLATGVPVGQPIALASVRDTLYVVDDAGVQAVHGGAITTMVAAGSGRITVDGQPTAFFPSAIAVDAAGDLYVADASPKELLEFSAAGQLLRSWPTYVSTAGLATAPDDDHRRRLRQPRRGPSQRRRPLAGRRVPPRLDSRPERSVPSRRDRRHARRHRLRRRRRCQHGRRPGAHLHPQPSGAAPPQRIAEHHRLRSALPHRCR